jgi:hypothetical protein
MAGLLIGVKGETRHQYYNRSVFVRWQPRHEHPRHAAPAHRCVLRNPRRLA